jgi:hypothetical protein
MKTGSDIQMLMGGGGCTGISTAWRSHQPASEMKTSSRDIVASSAADNDDGFVSSVSFRGSIFIDIIRQNVYLLRKLRVN